MTVVEQWFTAGEFEIQSSAEILQTQAVLVSTKRCPAGPPVSTHTKYTTSVNG